MENNALPGVHHVTPVPGTPKLPHNVVCKSSLLERTTAKLLGTPSRPSTVKFSNGFVSGNKAPVNQTDGQTGNQSTSHGPPTQSTTQGKGQPPDGINGTRLFQHDKQERAKSSKPGKADGIRSSHVNLNGHVTEGTQAVASPTDGNTVDTALGAQEVAVEWRKTKDATHPEAGVAVKAS